MKGKNYIFFTFIGSQNEPISAKMVLKTNHINYLSDIALIFFISVIWLK